MDDSESTNQATYLQNIYRNLKNKVFSPKALGSLKSNMAAPVVDERNLDVVKLQAFVLAKDIVHYVSEYETLAPVNEHAKTMRRTVDEVRLKYEIPLKGMFKKLRKELNLDENEESSHRAIDEVFNNIMHEMFRDSSKNFGRVVTVYAFGGLFAKYLAENEMEHLVDYMGLVLGEYVCTFLASWIHQNGGWDEFDKYFAEPGAEMERNIMRGLRLFAGVGVVGTAILVGVGMVAVR